MVFVPHTLNMARVFVRLKAYTNVFLSRQCGGARLTDWCAFASMLSGKQQAGKRVPLGGQDSMRVKSQLLDTEYHHNQG
jgi:hypothetical protein